MPAEHSTGMAGNSAEQRKAETMTQFHFMRLCEDALIMPEIALEHEAIRVALAKRNDEEVARLIREDF